MKAVILAGGLGSRLKPFTEIIPKPLLPLGEKSLMEIQLEKLKLSGFDEVYLAVNYKAEYIKSFLGDGSNYGLKLHYSLEGKPLGTCGPISLLSDVLTEPFLLMNGDVLSKADFTEFYSFALSHKDSLLTIMTKIISTPFRFGKIISSGDYVTDIEEKPDINFEVLAGMYILKPEIFELIPPDTYFGMDDLIKIMLHNNKKISKYLLKDYWIDIGVIEDYEEARTVYKNNFE
jgi:NDP-sugar pyrophosphorylase family protein